MNTEQFEKVKSAEGFIAALDQSGGSTPKALGLYGIDESAWSNDDEMFDLIHQMRTRIVTSASFDGDRILGAILFEQTMDRDIEGKGTAEYLWGIKQVVPFLKVDKGLADEADGVQVMKPIGGLDDLLERAVAKGVFGTKMRSVIKVADPTGVTAVVAQQFEIGRQILGHGLVPIIEPEVDIHSPEKEAAETLLRGVLLRHLDTLDDGRLLMSFPRAGHLCAAQILAELGSVRERFDSDEHLAAEAGVAPVTYTSGKSRAVTFRWACNHRLRAALTCLADNSRHANAWAASVYAKARARGCDHPHAIRILARAWVRVLWRCWKTATPYDPVQHGGARRLPHAA